MRVNAAGLVFQVADETVRMLRRSGSAPDTVTGRLALELAGQVLARQGTAEDAASAVRNYLTTQVGLFAEDDGPPLEGPRA